MMENQNNSPKDKKPLDKLTNDDSDAHEDILGENTEETPLAKEVKGDNEDERQTPSEEL